MKDFALNFVVYHGDCNVDELHTSNLIEAIEECKRLCDSSYVYCSNRNEIVFTNKED